MIARELAAILHKQVCHGLEWSEKCQRPDGGDHALTQLASARAILTAPDPAVPLHDYLCEAHVHWSAHGGLIPSVRCPDRPRHIEVYRVWAAQLGLIADEPQPDLFGGAA